MFELELRGSQKVRIELVGTFAVRSIHLLIFVLQCVLRLSTLMKMKRIKSHW